MKSVRLLAVIFLIACAQLAAATQSQFAERITVTEVEIPVRVLVDGKPVRGLTADDFELFDRGVRQQILSCEERDLSQPVPFEQRLAVEPAPNPEASEGRKLLIVFDSYFSRRQYLLRALRGVRQTVASRTHPTDQVAVAIYNGATGLSLVEGFTSDRKRVALALDVVEAILSSDRKALREAYSELRQLVDEQLAFQGEGPRVQQFERVVAAVGPTAALALEGTKRGAAGLDAGLGVVSIFGIGQEAGFRPPSGRSAADPTVGQLLPDSPAELAEDLAVNSVTSDVRALALTLGDTVTLLRELGGEKQMIFLSEGFAGGLLSDSKVLFHIQNMLQTFRQTGWTLHAVDVRGIPDVDRPAFDTDSLLFMAKETGGELYENYNNLALATDRVLERTSVTYMLTFQPTDLVLDGSFHEVEVKLKSPPSKVRLHHRPGYQAPSPWAERGQLERRVDAAEMILSNEEIAGMEVSVLAAPVPEPSGGWRVPIVVEIPGGSLLPEDRESRRRKAVVEVHVYAIDGSGAVLDLMVNGFRLNLKRLASSLEQGGLRIVGGLGLGEGEYRIRVLVRYEETGGLFLSTVPVSLGAQGEAISVLLPPLFFSLADDWLVIKDRTSQMGGSAAALPFRVGQFSFVPAVRPILQEEEAIGVFLIGSDLSRPDLRFGSRVLTAAGEEVSGGELDVLERLLDDPDGLDRVVGTFRSGGLAAGEYRLEVTTALEDGRILSRQSSTFEVQN